MPCVSIGNNIGLIFQLIKKSERRGIHQIYMAQVRYVPQGMITNRVIGIIITNKDIGIITLHIVGTRRRNIRRRIKKSTTIFA